METLFKAAVAAIFIVLFAAAPPAFSQTPDGLTPAQESVCDPLRNATPGLYGLCVEYCEAHDAELISLYGDPAELNTPDVKLLINYNRKKKDSDPAMPCVLEESESCPCWTEEQLAEMLPPGSNFDQNYPHACLNSEEQIELENFEFGMTGPGFQLGVYRYEGCSVTKHGDYTAGAPDGFGFPSPEEEASCKAMLIEHARNNSTTGAVWDCFD